MVSILNRVSGQYFETAGISIVAGRGITPADTADSLKVAVVSQTLAKKYFPKGDAIGRQLTVGIDSVKGPWQIVGIAKDTKSGDPRDTDPAPAPLSDPVSTGLPEERRSTCHSYSFSVSCHLEHSWGGSPAEHRVD